MTIVSSYILPHPPIVIEPIGKGGPELLWLTRDLLLDTEPVPELTHHSTHHGPPVGAVGRRADEVYDQVFVGPPLAIVCGPLGEQR